VNKKYFIL